MTCQYEELSSQISVATGDAALIRMPALDTVLTLVDPSDPPVKFVKLATDPPAVPVIDVFPDDPAVF